VVSGVLSDAEIGDLRNRGIDDFLRKPFTFEQVRDTIFRQLKVF
jgi:hypothetical protein